MLLCINSVKLTNKDIFYHWQILQKYDIQLNITLWDWQSFCQTAHCDVLDSGKMSLWIPEPLCLAANCDWLGVIWNIIFSILVHHYIDYDHKHISWCFSLLHFCALFFVHSVYRCVQKFDTYKKICFDFPQVGRIQEYSEYYIFWVHSFL